MFRVSQALQGCRGGSNGERIYSSGEGTRLTPRTAAKGMREHIHYVFTGVVQASQLKALRAGEGRHTQAFWGRRGEKTVPKYSVLAQPWSTHAQPIASRWAAVASQALVSGDWSFRTQCAEQPFACGHGMANRSWVHPGYQGALPPVGLQKLAGHHPPLRVLGPCLLLGRIPKN